jgi:tRNA threonylcarbamoyladenosine biosynthesis protein TsaE
MPEALTLTATTAADLQTVGERLGRALQAGDVLALVGPLGAGKTTFVQGIARGVEVPSERHVASPTFALVNEHPGRVPLVHADLYRINDPRELDELGLADAFDRAAVAIEWLDRFPEAAPAERLTIEIAIAADGARRIAFQATGARAEALVRSLAGLGAPPPQGL